MKVLIRAVFGAALVSFLVQPSPIMAQKTKPIELNAQFRDDYSDKIHSDGGGLDYTVRDPDRVYASVVQLDADGRLKMEILRHRKVIFEFDSPVRPAPLTGGQLTCHDYNGDVVFYVDPPSFLTGVPDYSSVYFTTFGKITYDGTGWVYDPSTMFDFRTMPVDANAGTLVRVQINFATVEDRRGTLWCHAQLSAVVCRRPTGRRSGESHAPVRRQLGRRTPGPGRHLLRRCAALDQMRRGSRSRFPR